MSLTKELKREIKRLGADLVGVAPVERFEGAPRLPQELLPRAKSVVVIGARIPLASVENWKTIMKSYQIYGHGWLNFHLSYLEYNAVRFLEDNGYRALPLSSLDPYYNMETFLTEGLSNRHAAAAAGLGEFGWNNLLLTPEFGPRVRFTSTITDAPLEGDELYNGPKLCKMENCFRCVEECPMGIFNTTETTVINIGGKVHTMASLDLEKKYLCRWCEHGLTNKGGALTNIELPKEKTPDAYLNAWENRDKYQKRRQGLFGGIYFCGKCVHSCPVGKAPQLKPNKQ